jgi:peptide/nickel transport system permease protein
MSTRRRARTGPRARGYWRDAFVQLLGNPRARFGLGCVALFLAGAVLAPVLSRYSPTAGNLVDRLQPPNVNHPMGTDLLGRDELSRVLFGARLSLEVGVLSVLAGLAMGIALGSIAGTTRGWIDAATMRTTDVFLAMPGILLAIGIVTWLSRGIPQLMLAIALTQMPVYTRLMRGELLAVREQEFVAAAQSMGASSTRLLARHLLPNALTPLIVQAAISLATAIIDVAGLGFLGLGPPDPATAEWGTMLTDAVHYLTQDPYLLVFPGLAIFVSAIGFNLLGDGLREALDPKLRA